MLNQIIFKAALYVLLLAITGFYLAGAIETTVAALVDSGVAQEIAKTVTLYAVVLFVLRVAVTGRFI